MISCARRYSKPGVGKRADMWYNNIIICRRGIPCSAKQHSLSPCSLPPRKSIPKQRAQNCFAPTNKTDGKTPSVFFVGLPSPRLRGLNLFACYIYGKESARLARFNIQALFELSAQNGADLRCAGCERGGSVLEVRDRPRDVLRAAKVCCYVRSSINFCYYAKAQGCVRRDV